MSKTSTKSKDKYNESSYARYTFRVRKDSVLYEDIEEFMSHKNHSLNYVITETLSQWFSDRNHELLQQQGFIPIDRN